MGSLDEIIFKAYTDKSRRGDTLEEVEAIREYIKSAEVLVVPTRNEEKLKAINDVLNDFGLKRARGLSLETKFADKTRLPALTKALMCLDVCECDLVIARGRLGVPGSGSMLVVIDNRGRVLTASLSPPHVLHRMDVRNAVRIELKDALERIGFKRM